MVFLTVLEGIGREPRGTKLVRSLQTYVCKDTFAIVEPDLDLDVTAVRALAHPLRLRMLDLLRFEGPATATMLAGRVAESSGSTSYHLRQLARHGFIEEMAKRRGRERWWAYRERQFSIAGNTDSGSVQTVLGELLSREAYALHRYLSSGNRDAAWDEAAFFQTKAVVLTATELKELRAALDATLAHSIRTEQDNPPHGARPVRILAFGFPQPIEGP